MTELPKLITIKQTANLLGVSALTLRNWDNNGKLKASRHPINNYRVYKREDIEKLIDFIGKNTSPDNHPKKKSPKKLSVRHLD